MTTRPLRPRSVAIGLVAVAVLVAAVAYLLTRETRTPVAEFESLSETACPALSAGSRGGDVIGGEGTIPAGAVQVALCPLEERNYSTVIAPRDALTDDVNGLADEVNSQDEFDSEGCPDVGGFVYQLAFSYADGSVRLVQANTGGCGTIDAAGTERHGAEAVFKAFISRLAEQRLTATPPENTEQASCAYPGTALGNSVWPIQDVEHLVSARVCVRYIFHSELNGSRRLTPRELAIINPELSAEPENEPTLTCGRRPKTPELDVTLQAIDKWDGRVHVQLDSCLITSLGGPAPQLSPEAQQIIDRLVTVIREDEPPGTRR